MSASEPTGYGGLGFKAIVRRVSCMWPVKLWGTLACAAGFMLLYFAAQRWGWREAVAVPTTRIDEWVGFDPGWTLMYESLWLLLPIAPWLAGRAEDIRRYLIGFGMMCAVAFPVFFLWPMDAPRPEVVPDHTLYRWLVSIDGTRNSLPSMHAALGVYTVFVSANQLRELLSPWAWRVAVVMGWVWLLCILYATLTTKQHGVIDLPPGMLLGGMAYCVAWRARARLDLKGVICRFSKRTSGVSSSS
ncbi:MAG: phosphatase PAP2 family protein [Planctomycetota bacterium]